jgi:DNA polymerase-3 subunit beta
LIDGVYPTYEQIIPTKFVTEISVDRAEFIQAVKQAAVFAKDVGNVVKLSLKPIGKIFVSASTRQVGEGSSEVKAAVSGEELEVAINSAYLLAGLDNLSGDKAEIKFSGSLKPAIIYGNNPETFSYVVMPVKPQN